MFLYASIAEPLDLIWALWVYWMLKIHTTRLTDKIHKMRFGTYYPIFAAVVEIKLPQSCGLFPSLLAAILAILETWLLYRLNRQKLATIIARPSCTCNETISITHITYDSPFLSQEHHNICDCDADTQNQHHNQDNHAPIADL